MHSDSAEWNGNTTTGIYVDTLQTDLGCDSVVTMNLVVNNTVYYVDTQEACDSYIWNGTIYDSSGLYVDTLQSITIINCDSIVTLDLTINYTSSSIQSEISCDSYLWNGNLYK